MTSGSVSVIQLESYKVTVYDDGKIKLYYSRPRNILIEDTLLRIGSLQVIGIKNILKIVIEADVAVLYMKNEQVIKLHIVTT